MLDFLKDFQLSGYDPEWYAGYPAFVLYPPLFYMLVALLSLLSGGIVPLSLSFNLTQFLLVPTFLGSLYFCTLQWLGKRVAAVGVLLGIFYLCLPPHFAHSGNGLAAALQIGFLPNFLGYVELLLLLGTLKGPLNFRKFASAAILLAALILTHQLTAVFALGAIALLIMMQSHKEARKTICVLLFGLVLSSWWWVPSLDGTWIGSGEVIGLQMEFPDPLLVIYPELTFGSLHGLLDAGWREALWHAPDSIGSRFIYAVCYVLKFFPYTACLLLCGHIAGLSALIRGKQWYLPTLFIVSLLILPRAYLAQLFVMPLHYYRFLQPIYLLALLIAARGLVEIYDFVKVKWVRLPLKFAVVCATAFTAFVRFDLHNAAPTDSVRQGTFHLFLDEYPHYRQALRMMEYLKSLHPRGRVLDEGAQSNWFALGSPHFFTALLPLNYQIPVAGGLMVESSFLAGFINSTAYKESDKLRWGRRALWNNPRFPVQSLESMMQRLSYMGTEYIVVSSRRYMRALSGTRTVEIIKQFGRFALFKIKLPRSSLTLVNRPFYYVDEGMTFREFSEAWFIEPTLLPLPVVTHPFKLFNDLPDKEKDAFAGIIIGKGRKSVLLEKEFALWKTLGKPVIALDAIPGASVPLNDFMTFLPNFTTHAEGKSLGGYLRSLGYDDLKAKERIELRVDGPEKMIIRGNGGILLKYGYSPRWESSGGEVFLATPGFLFTIVDGKATLQHR